MHACEKKQIKLIVEIDAFGIIKWNPFRSIQLHVHNPQHNNYHLDIKKYTE